MGAVKYGVLGGLFALSYALFGLSFLIKACAVLAVLYYFAAQWSRPATILKPDNGKVSKNLGTNRFTEDKVPKDLDYVIIGSGMSGLHSAAILSRMGYKVCVLEQHTLCGGATHMFDLKGYWFDSGLHYTVPWSEEVMKLACGTVKAPVKFELMGEPDTTYDKVYLGNDPVFNVKYKEAHLKEIYAMFPEEKAAIDEYMKISNTILMSTPLYFVSKIFPLWVQKLIWQYPLAKFAKLAGQTSVAVLDTITKNKKLQSLLTSLWIDTGARPDTCTFFLMASVFRGFPQEGGCYPRGGSGKMAEELIKVVERYGGAVLVRARVNEILCDSNNRAVGVRVNDNCEVMAKHGVISTAGYRNTFGKLLPEAVTTQAKMPRDLPVAQGAGFVMVNLAIKGSAKDLGITNTNVWHLPATADGDAFKPLQAFFSNPLENEAPVMITFPSVKDQGWAAEHPDKTTCQILAMADYEWFVKWKDEVQGDRGEEYNKLKLVWQEKLLKTFFKYFPKVEGHIDFIDVSTPLSIEFYLDQPRGTAIGLDVSPGRFNGDPELLRLLDLKSPVEGLYQAGQDTLLCGVVLAQITGVLLSLRILGFAGALKFILRTAIHGGEGLE